MQQACHGGLAVAQQIAHVYQENPTVAAVMVSGSIARGIGDHYSDLEIGVFWHDPPTDQARQQAVAALKGELWLFTSFVSGQTAIASEHYGLQEITLGGQSYPGSVMIDTKHGTVADIDTIMHEVLEQYNTTSSKHMLLAAIVDGIPLHGVPLLTAWQERACMYPLPLSVKVIQEHLWFGPWFNPQAYIERDDHLVLTQHLIWMQQNLLYLLAGLNRIYYPSSEYKWMDATLERFIIKPGNLAARLKQALHADPAMGIQEMMRLIRETIALVKQHCPEVDQMPMFKGHEEVTTTWHNNGGNPGRPIRYSQQSAQH